MITTSKKDHHILLHISCRHSSDLDQYYPIGKLKKRSLFKAEIKWDYRGDIREYFNESKIV